MKDSPAFVRSAEESACDLFSSKYRVRIHNALHDMPLLLFFRYTPTGSLLTCSYHHHHLFIFLYLRLLPSTSSILPNFLPTLLLLLSSMMHYADLVHTVAA
jgi:hypothetical protein